MYKKRDKYSRKLKAMREAKDRKRIEGPASDYPPVLPMLRRKIIIEDLDFGIVRHEINLYRTNRIDLYNMEVDGRPYASGIGWSRILEIIRKQFLRVHSA